MVLKNKLQFVKRCHNNAARVISLRRKFDHITPILHDLHWLPVRYRIIYKILVLTHKSLYDEGPVYLKDLLKWYVPTCNLRSKNMYYLEERKWRLKTFGAGSFQCAAPQLWNKMLDLSLRSEHSVDKFRLKLKTHLFKLAYPC